MDGMFLGHGQAMRASAGRLAACALAMLLAALLCSACSGGAKEVRLAAKYDGGTITEDEVAEYTESFRKARSYEDDGTWALYLAQEGLTTETWRYRAIGAIVEDRLLTAEMDEKGIEPDEGQVNDQMAAARESLGLADDDAAWASHLKSLGLDERSYREALERTSRLSQLFSQELQIDDQVDSGKIDAYIDENLVSRVVRRYSVLVYDSRDAAEAALAQLSGLQGDELAARFADLSAQDDSDVTSPENGGDWGWDLAASMTDFVYQLNQEMLAPGTLSSEVHEAGDVFCIAMCTKRFEFQRGTAYADLPDYELQATVKAQAQNSLLSQMQADYIAQLRDAAHVQVQAMPDDLSYDVDEKIAELE